MGHLESKYGVAMSLWILLFALLTWEDFISISYLVYKNLNSICYLPLCSSHLFGRRLNTDAELVCLGWRSTSFEMFEPYSFDSTVCLSFVLLISISSTFYDTCWPSQCQNWLKINSLLALYNLCVWSKLWCLLFQMIILLLPCNNRCLII